MENREIFMDTDEMEKKAGSWEDAEEDAAGEEERSMYVRFNRPFLFEEESYEGIDLSGLENLTARDLGEIEKRFYRLGITSLNSETTVSYARITSQRATGMPIEFFDQLPAREMLKVKKAVVNFFFISE